MIQPVIERGFGNTQGPTDPKHLEAIGITKLIRLPPADSENFPDFIDGICPLSNRRNIHLTDCQNLPSPQSDDGIAPSVMQCSFIIRGIRPSINDAAGRACTSEGKSLMGIIFFIAHLSGFHEKQPLDFVRSRSLFSPRLCSMAFSSIGRGYSAVMADDFCVPAIEHSSLILIAV